MISAIIITKNEEKNISRCLESLKFCQEIIIVDNGSTDKTVEICRRHTNKIFSITTQDFSKMREMGAQRAKGEWLLYVDADEVVSEKLKQEIIKLISQTDCMGFEIYRKNNFFGVWMKAGGWENEWLLRLMKKSALEKWQGALHETAIIKGDIGKINSPILHFSHQDLSECVSNTNVWSEIEADLRVKNNHPQMSVFRFIKLFSKELLARVFIKKAWKDGTVGIIEAIYQSYSLLITYFKLWEKQIKSAT